MLESKLSFVCEGEGVIDVPTFDVESKSTKIKNSQCPVGGRFIDFTTFDAESKSAKNLKNPYFWFGGGVIDFPAFDAESKFAKIQNCLCWGEGGVQWYILCEGLVSP